MPELMKVTRITLRSRRKHQIIQDVKLHFLNNRSIRPVKLTRAFFESTDVVSIANLLLGTVLCTYFSGKLTKGIIVETEAYRAPEDKASHAYNNKRTARTEVMYGKAGHVYIYLCYGIHHLFNVVTGPVGTAHAILIRAIEPLAGVEHMLVRRKMTKSAYKLSSGPGSLSCALGLETKYSGLNLTATDSPVWIENRPMASPTAIDKAVTSIVASPRVGVAYSQECATWPWRFRIKNNPWTSPAK
jgi:DNA-3-methyladenine glycosylase